MYTISQNVVYLRKASISDFSQPVEMPSGMDHVQLTGCWDVCLNSEGPQVGQCLSAISGGAPRAIQTFNHLAYWPWGEDLVFHYSPFK